MTTYRVEVPERWTQVYLVEADDPEDARKRVRNGEGRMPDNALWFVETIEEDNHPWPVEEDDE